MSFRIPETQRNYDVAGIASRQWVMLIMCDAGHSVRWTGADLLARFPAGALSGQIADRLKCGTCGMKDGAVGFKQDRSPEARKRTARKDAGAKGVY